MSVELQMRRALNRSRPHSEILPNGDRVTLEQLSDRLQSLVSRLDGLGIARTADDLRLVANDLRTMSDESLVGQSDRVDDAIERLSSIHLRLTGGGLPILAADAGKLLLDLRVVHQSSSRA